MLAHSSNFSLGTGRSPRLFDRYSRRRMCRRPRGGRTCTDLNHIRNRIPFTVQLPDLLLVDFEQKRNLMVALSGFRLYEVQVEPAPRGRVQDPHQCPLGIPIANVETLHVFVPRNARRYSAGSSSSNISDKAAPAGTIGNTLASGAQSNTSNSGSGECRNRSI